MKSSSSAEINEQQFLEKALKYQGTSFQDVKEQIATKGLTEQALLLLRHLFIDYQGNLLPETCCLEFLEALTLDAKNAKLLNQNSKLQKSLKMLYADLITLYVNKRANRAAALFQSIPIDTLVAKEASEEANDAYTNDFQQLTTFVTYDVLFKPTYEHTLLAADRWMQIMQKSLQDRRDFHTLFAINGGLHSLNTVSGEDHSLLSEKSCKIHERVDALQSGHNMPLRALTMGAVIPYLGIYKGDLEFVKNQHLDSNNNNTTTENIEVKKNVLDKLKDLQQCLKQLQELHKNTSHQQPQSIEKATPSEFTTLQNAFMVLSREFDLFYELPDGYRKCQFILTALALNENSQEFFVEQFERIQSNEWKDLLKGICQNLVLENNGWLQNLLLKSLDKYHTNKQKIELTAMINPHSSLINQLILPDDRKEVLINLSKSSQYHFAFVKGYINTQITDQETKEDLMKQISSITPSSADFDLLSDGKAILWELQIKRILKGNKIEEIKLANARELLPSLKIKEDANTELEELLIKARQFTSKVVDSQAKKMSRREIGLIIADMNTKHKITDKIKYLDDIIQNKIRPKSSQNDIIPTSLSKKGIELIKDLRKALRNKAEMDSIYIEKLQSTLVQKQNPLLKVKYASRGSLPLPESGSRSMENPSQILKSDPNDNNNSLFKTGTKKNSLADSKIFQSSAATQHIDKPVQTVEKRTRLVKASTFEYSEQRSQSQVPDSKNVKETPENETPQRKI